MSYHCFTRTGIVCSVLPDFGKMYMDGRTTCKNKAISAVFDCIRPNGSHNASNLEKMPFN